MFGRLVLAFSGRSGARAAELGGGGGARRKAADSAKPAAAVSATAGGLDEKDPDPPAATVSLVERCRLRVDPLGGLGGRVPCGPFSWRLDESLGQLEVAKDTTAAWFYPRAVGACRVTVSGGKRESTITINVVEAVPVTLNLIADQPEVFRDVASVGTAGLVDKSGTGVM